MSKITYETELKVRLDGLIVGKIRELRSNLGNKVIGYQYVPNGGMAYAGDIHQSLESCKKSLESD